MDPVRTIPARQVRYFGRDALAGRYADARPRLHEELLRTVLEGADFERALDVGCGTGHSTLPLLARADEVWGCDASPVMLAEARERVPRASFASADAEALPFGDSVFDLITVGMAFHWFDQDRFLREAARVLAPGGCLVTYDLAFVGRLVGDERFSAWFREVYLARFPTPVRDRTPLADRLSEAGPLRFEARAELDLEVEFTARGLRDYLTTQSNVEAALRAGAALDEVDAWIDEGVAVFLPDQRARRFEWVGRAETARRAR